MLNYPRRPCPSLRRHTLVPPVPRTTRLMLRTSLAGSVRAIRAFFEQKILHLRTDHAVDRNVLASDELTAIVAIGLEPSQRIDDGLVGTVVGTKPQSLQNQR